MRVHSMYLSILNLQAVPGYLKKNIYIYLSFKLPHIHSFKQVCAHKQLTIQALTAFQCALFFLFLLFKSIALPCQQVCVFLFYFLIGLVFHF